MANNKNTEVDSFSKVMGILTKVGVGLFAVALVFTLVYSALNATGVLGKLFTAVEVGDTKLSVEEFDLYYNEERINLLNQYGSMLQLYYGVDLSQPLETQMYSETMTWGQYLRNAAKDTVTSTFMVYEEGQKAGYQMTEEDQLRYDAAMKSYTQAAETYEMDLEEYVEAVYGKGVELSDIQEMVRIRIFANCYARSLQDGYRSGITSDAVNKYYEENRGEFDNISYREFLFSYSSGDEASKTEAKKKADEFIAKVKDDQSFIDASVAAASDNLKESYADEEYTLADMLWSDKPSGEKATWLCSADRKANDTTVADTGSSYSCLLFRSMGRDEENTINVRHILVAATKPTQPTEPAADASQADKDAYQEDLKAYEENLKAYNEAKAEIESIQATWEASAKTEAVFAELANKHSDDSPVGGLYEEVMRDDMVEEFDAWIFDDARKTGDSAIVETSYGFHLMYFVGEGRQAWYVTAEDTLVSDQYTEWYDKTAEGYPVVYHEKTVGLIK